MTIAFNTVFSRIIISMLLVAGYSLASSEAFAHARWSAAGSTPGRTNSDGNKVGPCGAARTSNPAVFKAGETVTLQWEATINHKGYFRIAFSPASDQGFDDNVLLDNIPERNGTGLYTAEVTLPAEPCDQCTLQMIQVMLDRNPPTNYYSCADIKLVANTPVDFEPPADVANFNIQGSAPAVTLMWQNPVNDFAGVLIVRSTNEGAAPADGTEYKIGDTIGNATVAYIGSAQQASISDAQANEQFAIYAFDLANNYSDGTALTAPMAAINSAPAVSLKAEQISQAGNGFFAADGLILLQASITDTNPSDTHQLSWQVPAGVDYQSNPSNQLEIDPSASATGIYTIVATAIDSGQPVMSGSAQFELNIQPYSRYQPKLVMLQGGREVTSVNVSDGEVTLKVGFAGDTPTDLADWSVDWVHSITGATEGGLTLRFTPSDNASYSIEALVSTATAPAAPKLTQSITTSKPVKIGLLHPLLGCFLLIGLWLKCRVRLQRER